MRFVPSAPKLGSLYYPKTSMKDFLAFFTIHLKDQASYRAAMVIFFLGTLFHIGVAILVWLNAQNTQFSGYTKPELLTYYLLFLVLDAILGWYVLHPVANQIIDGQILSYMLKPVSYIKAWIGMETSWKVTGAFVYILGSLTLTLILLSQHVQLAPLSLSMTEVGLAVLAGLFAIALTFLLNFILGLLAFWFTEVQFIDYIYFTIIPFLTGELMPNTFLPPIVQLVNQYLPFRYHMSFVLEILLHKTGGMELVKGFVISGVWVVFYIFLAQFVWKKGTRAYMAFGQ